MKELPWSYLVNWWVSFIYVSQTIHHMSDSSGGEYVDPQGDADKGVVENLLDALGSQPHRVRHLYDILQGDTKAPGDYYENSGSFDNVWRWGSHVVGLYPDRAVEFMNRADAEFTHYNLRKNEVVNFLAEEGISRHVSEELASSWTELLLLTYHALYDPETGELPRYNLLRATARLFKHRSKHAYRYQEIDLENIEGRVSDFVRSYNKGNNRPLSINCYRLDEDDAEEEEVVLDLYQESVRVAQPIFDIRLDETENNPLEPNIQYDSTYSIKTLSLSIQETDDGYVVAFSKSPDNWDTFLDTFFGELFCVSEPLADSYRKRTESVERVLEPALDRLTDEDSSDEDVIDAIDGPIEELAEEATSSEAAESLDVESEELAEIFDSIDVVGITVERAEETLTDTFRVSSTATLRDWTKRNVSEEDSLKRVVEDADEKWVGFILRGNLRGEDSQPEEFVLQNGIWKAGQGGVSDEATEVLNTLFESHDR